ncbi:MAG: C1 family peptidase [Ancrocorticia sp.]|jgi:bleomycin hydrolase|nr:C1 family peptidase [Ancrocorticia sp.]MCI1962738.1 C1 family peptidase [Ancrocorticia sp.]MCI2001982.1 C1 family peptidase [Ancrocorticia sp.]MCI2013222.1 C1 family peptidase [Ancrocorticia sp.]MCI2030069.1 C1 family peptidase [Ancrocorticia sp.]
MSSLPQVTTHPEAHEPRPLTADFASAQIAMFRGDAVGKIVQNAVSAQGADAISMDRDIINAIDESVSERLDTWGVTNQKHSGRCWEFAGLNVLRARMIHDLNLDDFAFSQNYIAFFDKLEKANHVLTLAIEMADQPDSAEDVRDLFKELGDGGFWTQFLDIVHKYGLVPVWAMPDTESSGNTDQMNRALTALLRRSIGRIRRAYRSTPIDLDDIRTSTMKEIWRILAIHLGTPPTSFVWQYRDKDKNFHSEGEMTPLDFARKYVPGDITDYVALTHDPREEHPEGRRYVIEHTPYMEGGTPYTHVTAPIEDLKRAAIASIREGEPVWFSCDVNQQFDRKSGIWDAHLHDYDALYGLSFQMSKADRMRLHHTAPTHAMVFTGVDLVDGKPRRWRVENSWGDEVGKKGFFTMNDSWFNEYVFQVIVAPRHLTEAQRRAAHEEPILIPHWDALTSF